MGDASGRLPADRVDELFSRQISSGVGLTVRLLGLPTGLFSCLYDGLPPLPSHLSRPESRSFDVQDVDQTPPCTGFDSVQPGRLLGPTIQSRIFATVRRNPTLCESLDAQTLPTDQWEVVFVDDGSPDDTLEMLRRVAAERPHFPVYAIEHSGWPSKPRNLGV